MGMIHVSSQNILPDKIAIDKIDSSMSGSMVRAEGEISSKGFSGGNLFLTLKDGNSSIKVVKFNAEDRFSEGVNVVVEGEVAIYRGEMEIIASEIEKSE
ncbi:hypothetical protein GLU60_01330 [Nanohaloarchaea archaeon H01]|nr:hypothetical protein [Nanohaloarchaea archaeon H01]